MTRLSEEEYHPRTPNEIEEKLNVSEQEIIKWRKRAPNVPEDDPEEKKNHRGGQLLNYRRHSFILDRVI